MTDIKNFGETLRKGLEKLTAVTFEDLQLVYEDTICNAILEEELSGEREYVGGELVYECVDDKNFTCEYNLYFRDAQDKFFKRSAKTGELSMEPLLSEVRDELTAEKIVKFEIPEPSDEARAQYEQKRSKPQNSL